MEMSVQSLQSISRSSPVCTTSPLIVDGMKRSAALLAPSGSSLLCSA